ncbi:ANTAR domain-containing protein [Streptomyces sp. BH-SS-21]|uniref:ANTAR domain-containing protein n=2 Tax=Streptomyces liliiviolaceus TaxID=2823109 RepID=A0A941BD75_9ACTN|nr:ANTAR domain-containing protein [Streptomyces liliiviolaceus]
MFDARVDGGNSPETGATAQKVAELQEEVDQLKSAVRSHATVDQAIGVVLAVGRLSPDDAWLVIRDVSMRTNIKVRDVSQQIVDWGRTGVLADALRAELEDQLSRRRERLDAQ